MSLATLWFICAYNRPSSSNELPPLSNENYSAFISRSNITTPFEEWSYEYDERKQSPSNDAAKSKKAIINSDNSNDTTLHHTISSSEVISYDLKHCSLNNDNSINDNRRNKTAFNSFQSDLVVIGWGQTLIS